MNPDRKPRMLTAGEVATRWKCSTRTVQNLIRAGKLPAVKINSRVILVTEVDAALTYLNFSTTCTTPHRGRPLGT